MSRHRRAVAVLIAIATIVSGCSLGSGSYQVPESQAAEGSPTGSQALDSLLAAPDEAPDPVAPTTDEDGAEASASRSDAVSATTTATTTASTTTSTAQAADNIDTQWAAPVDEIRILNRVIMTGRWAGRQDPRTTPVSELGARGLCRYEVAVPLPAAENMTTRRWSGGAIDASFSIAVFEFNDAQRAAEFAADAVTEANACLPSEINGANAEALDLSQYGLTPDNYSAMRFAYSDSERTEELVLTTHDRLAFVVQMQTADDPSRYDSSGWQELLEKLDLALASPPLIASTDSPLISADEFEEMMVSNYREKAFAYAPDEYQCILGETIDSLESRGSKPPGAVLSYITRWCAPTTTAATAAAREWPHNIRVEDPEARLCYATVLVESQLRPTYLDMIDDRDVELDPYGAARAAIDSRLLNECGLTADEGVIAGLDPREPLDDSAQREPFCAGWKEGLGIGSTRDLPEIEGLVTRYQASAAQARRLVPPPSIASEWGDRATYFDEKARVHETEQIGEVALYTHDEFQAFEDEIGFDTDWDTIKQYLRINCGVEFGY